MANVLVLPATLTLNQTNAFVLAQARVIAAATAPQVTVDATPLTQFDSSALAALLALRRQALSAGKTFLVTGQSKRLQDLAGLYGVGELLGAG